MSERLHPKFELTEAMQELGITDLDISDPSDYRPPVTRMYAGASVPVRANEIYTRLHEEREGNRTNLSIAFDLVSQNGANPFKEGRAEIGKVGTALYDAHDMQTALRGIPLGETSTSMTINGTAPFQLASYIVAGEVTGVAKEQLRGTVQNDILKEHFRNTVSADLAKAFRLECDIIEYCTARGEVPHWYGLSASGYHMAEAGADAATEVGITQANAEAVLDELIARGHRVEDVAKKLSFFYVTRPDNFIEETAKLRAARIIWANRLLSKYDCTDPESRMMKIHVHTAGEAMPRQYVESGTLLAGHSALSAQLAPAQSLHVVGFREALSIPDERERTIGMYTPRLQDSAVASLRAILDTSPEFKQRINEQVAASAEVLLQIQEAGGSLQALEEELPQQMITEDFVRRDAAKTSGDLPVLGRNLGPHDSLNSSVDVGVVNQADVDAYLRGLSIRLMERDSERVKDHINWITATALNGANIMPVTIDAVRDGVTVWEWNEAVRQAIGSDSRPLLLESESRIMGNFAELDDVYLHTFTQFDKPPRVLVTKAGLDGHDKGVKMVIKIAEGSGFEVVQGVYRAEPADIVDQAIEENVDLIAVSILSGSHKEQAKAISNAINRALGPNARMGIIIGGTIPSSDIDELLAIPFVKEVVDSQTDPTIEEIGFALLRAAELSV